MSASIGAPSEYQSCCGGRRPITPTLRGDPPTLCNAQPSRFLLVTGYEQDPCGDLEVRRPVVRSPFGGHPSRAEPHRYAPASHYNTAGTVSASLATYVPSARHKRRLRRVPSAAAEQRARKRAPVSRLRVTVFLFTTLAVMLTGSATSRAARRHVLHGARRRSDVARRTARGRRTLRRDPAPSRMPNSLPGGRSASGSRSRVQHLANPVLQCPHRSNCRCCSGMRARAAELRSRVRDEVAEAPVVGARWRWRTASRSRPFSAMSTSRSVGSSPLADAIVARSRI
jgi:hypothetical protein